jgi:HSP20 family protein
LKLFLNQKSKKMTTIRVKPETARVGFPTLNNLFDNFFEGDFTSNAFKSIAPVNTIETKDNFTLEISAPGFEKEQIQISVDENVLTISAEKEEKKLEEGERFTRKEYSHNSFKRHFTLPKTIKVPDINAAYKNGTLIVTLPKQDEAKAKSVINVSVN